MSWWTVDETNDPNRTSWVESANGHRDFPVQNLPFGIFSTDGDGRRIGVAIGEMILDLQACAERGLVPPAVADYCRDDCLNRLMAAPAGALTLLRRRLSTMLSQETARGLLEEALYPAIDCVMHLPARIGDYTDFYVGIHHAENIGRQFRPDNPLLPNYKFVPIGYHGRASSVRPSGVAVVRPKGQRKGADEAEPSYGPSRRLDYELELGVWIGRGNELGETIPVGQAAEHIAGFCLLNDWSARDIQAWEYQPLGPFLSKSFHTSISPWVVSPQALAPFRSAQPRRPEGDPAPLPYLLDEDDQAHGALALLLEVHLSTARMRIEGVAPVQLSCGSAEALYWTVQQIVAHHASNGCDLHAGDLLGTGTISGPEKGSLGSLLEISRGGAEPISLPTGERRSFLEDGDEVSISARAEAPGHVAIGFGECRARIEPAR